MALILNIETTTDICSIGISDGGKSVVLREALEKNAHAARATIYIEECLRELGLGANDLDAVAVSSGPGSYTGLRIGFSTAKGICYALGKPFISLGTLNTLAGASRINFQEAGAKTLFCPMIDARRMEVYTLLEDYHSKEMLPLQAKILDENSFGEFFAKGYRMVFSGNGAFKMKEIIPDNSHVILDGVVCSAAHMAPLAEKAFRENKFEDVAYAVPQYLKSPYITKAKPKL